MTPQVASHSPQSAEDVHSPKVAHKPDGGDQKVSDMTPLADIGVAASLRLGGHLPSLPSGMVSQCQTHCPLPPGTGRARQLRLDVAPWGSAKKSNPVSSRGWTADSFM